MADDITSLSKSLKEMNETLIRIDERTKSMQTVIEQQKDDLGKLQEDTNKRFDAVAKRHDDLVRNIAENYVTKEKFSPVERVVYGLITLVLISVFGALIAMVVASPK
ncbi:hypothetical protein [Aureimonas altamirensis]|uniref:hypothetical protein n=1 Tax=Aureimonas altamirensis TaxID=370622 RepID=UPI00301A7911